MIDAFLLGFCPSVFLLLAMLGSMDWKMELLMLKLMLSIIKVSVGAHDFSPEKQSLMPLKMSFKFYVLLKVAVWWLMPWEGPDICACILV
jgi:hypothetical protein